MSVEPPKVTEPAPAPAEPAPAEPTPLAAAVAEPAPDPAPVAEPQPEPTQLSLGEPADIDARIAEAVARREAELFKEAAAREVKIAEQAKKAAIAEAEQAAAEAARRESLSEHARLSEDLAKAQAAAAEADGRALEQAANAAAAAKQNDFIRALHEAGLGVCRNSEGVVDPQVEALVFSRVAQQVDGGADFATALADVHQSSPALFESKVAPASTSTTSATGPMGTPLRLVPPNAQPAENAFGWDSSRWRSYKRQNGL